MRRATVRARIGISLVFFLAGFVFANWAARIPAVKDAIGVDDAQLAVAFVGLNAGAIIGLQAGAVLVPRYGSRAALRWSLPGFAACLVVVAVAGELATLTVAVGLFALLNSVVDVAMNSHGVAVEHRGGRPVLSRMHAMHSLGMIAGALAGAVAAHLSATPLVHFAIVAVFTALASVPAVRVLLPSSADKAEPKPHEAGRLRQMMVGGWSAPALWLGTLAFCCSLAEGSANDWSAVYLRDELQVSPSAAALGFAVFAGAMTIGRLAGDTLRSRVDPVWLFRAGTVVAGVGFAGSIVVDHPVAGFVGLIALGAGLSFTLPLALSAAGSLPGTAPATAVARVSTLAYLGSFVGPALIGGLAHYVGLAVALLLPALLVAASALGARALAPARTVTSERGQRRGRNAGA